MQLVSENALSAEDFRKLHASVEECLASVPTETLSETLKEEV